MNMVIDVSNILASPKVVQFEDVLGFDVTDGRYTDRQVAEGARKVVVER